MPKDESDLFVTELQMDSLKEQKKALVKANRESALSKDLRKMKTKNLDEQGIDKHAALRERQQSVYDNNLDQGVVDA